MQKVGTFTLKIVTRTDKAKGFEVLPSGWVVERACRRLARDWEKSIGSAEAWM